MKVGDGINSYMAYKVNTKTNLSFFKKKDASVSRRFSDFLGRLSVSQSKPYSAGDQNYFAKSKFEIKNQI